MPATSTQTRCLAAGLALMAACARAPEPAPAEVSGEVVAGVAEALTGCPWGDGECAWPAGGAAGLTVKDGATAKSEVAAKFRMSGTGYPSNVRLKVTKAAGATGRLNVELRADGGRTPADGALLAKGAVAAAGLSEAGAEVAVDLALVAPVTRVVSGGSYLLRLFADAAGGTFEAAVGVADATALPIAAAQQTTVTCSGVPPKAGAKPVCGAWAEPAGRPDVAFLPVFATVPAPSCFDQQLNGRESDVDCGQACGVPCGLQRVCASASDCAGDALCRPPTGENSDATCGKVSCRCVPLGAIGQSCGTDVHCASGRCVFPAGGGAAGKCEPTTCADGVRNGDEGGPDCGGSKCTARCDVGAACRVAGDCESGATCRAGFCYQPATKAGEACTADADCAAPMFCKGRTAKVCTAPQGAGETCTAGSQCQAGLVCNARLGQCAGLQLATAGCAVTADCAAGLFCKNRACTAPQAAGATCSASSECDTGLVCSSTTRKCATAIADGAGCKADVDCAAGLFCGGPATAKTCRGTPGAVDAGCSAGRDCASLVCSKAGRCVAATLTDKVKNGGESDVDCGVESAKCAVKKACLTNANCAEGLDCFEGKCLRALAAACGAADECKAPMFCSGPTAATRVCRDAFSCEDGLKNQSETDVDCGGVCASSGKTCAAQKLCIRPQDCASGSCLGGRCAAATCRDGLKNGDEKGVDCGSTACGLCKPGTLVADADATRCDSGVVAAGRCAPANCFDGRVNGDETARVGLKAECGGASCRACPIDAACRTGRDCGSGICQGATARAFGKCLQPYPNDKVKNGDETDVDCGGTSGKGCALGQACLSGADCAAPAKAGASVSCTANKCVDTSLCSNNATDAGEADRNCGGICDAKCAETKLCLVDSDCASNVCAKASPTAARPTCQPAATITADGRINANETGVDCGAKGEAPVEGVAKCFVGSGCDDDSDCLTNICLSGKCSNGVCGNGLNRTCGRDCTLLCASGSSATSSCRGNLDCASGWCQQDANGDGTCANIGCIIDRVAYQADAVNPSNALQYCDPSRPTTWSRIVCGDGKRQPGEACDDGNRLDQDGCTAQCKVAKCGDGIQRSGVEACDDGNGVDDDACHDDCTPARCGDAYQQANEQCEDHNTEAGDGCSPTCQFENLCLTNFGGCDSVRGTCTPGTGTRTCGCQAGWSGTGVGAGSCSDMTAPANATGVTATTTQSTLALSWLPVSDPDGSGFKEYRVANGLGPTAPACSAASAQSATSASFSGLTPNTSYAYRVCSVDLAGNVSSGATGLVSTPACTAIANCTSAVTCTTATNQTCATCASGYSGSGTGTCADTTAPNNVTGLAASSVAMSTLTLSWTAATDVNTGSGVAGYRIVSAIGSTPADCSTGFTTVTGVTTNLTGLTSSSNYVFRVCTVDNAGNV
ncbi:MAG: hypothetical protein RL199_1748, partial [Pseudomonadota bacterium]